MLRLFDLFEIQSAFITLIELLDDVSCFNVIDITLIVIKLC